MSEFNFLCCENYNNCNMEDNAYILVYFDVCVLPNQYLFICLLKIKQRLFSILGVVEYSKWNILSRIKSKQLNRNNNRSGTNTGDTNCWKHLEYQKKFEKKQIKQIPIILLR